jgi:hypothetical protein
MDRPNLQNGLGLELGLGEVFVDDGLGGGVLEVNGQVQGRAAIVWLELYISRTCMFPFSEAL